MLFIFTVRIPFTLSFYQHAASLGFARLETAPRVDYCWDSFRTGDRWFGPKGALQSSQMKEVPVGRMAISLPKPLKVLSFPQVALMENQLSERQGR